MKSSAGPKFTGTLNVQVCLRPAGQWQAYSHVYFLALLVNKTGYNDHDANNDSCDLRSLLLILLLPMPLPLPLPLPLLLLLLLLLLTLTLHRSNVKRCYAPVDQTWKVRLLHSV